MNSDRIYYSRDAQVQEMQERTILTVVFLTLGVGIGVTLALLFAPSSGKETRKDLSNTMEEGLSNGYDSIESTVKHLDGEFSKLRKHVDELLSQ